VREEKKKKMGVESRKRGPRRPKSLLALPLTTNLLGGANDRIDVTGVQRTEESFIIDLCEELVSSLTDGGQVEVE
jgi:hypothetical protein